MPSTPRHRDGKGVRPLPDDLPRDDVFVQPLVVSGLDVLDPVHLDDGRMRVAFRVTVRDAEGKRCPDLAVTGRISGPRREAQGMGHTDLMGRVTFRMTGPAGGYAFEMLDVAAGALDWDREASVLGAEVDAGAG